MRGLFDYETSALEYLQLLDRQMLVWRSITVMTDWRCFLDSVRVASWSLQIWLRMLEAGQAQQSENIK